MSNTEKITDTRKYWVWLSLCFGVGSIRAIKAMRVIGEPKEIFEADDDRIKALGFFKRDDKILEKLLERDLSESERIVSWCDANNITILTPKSEGYPNKLLKMSDMPVVLYVNGNLPDFKKMCSVAVVGTREVSDYGKIYSYRLGYGLAYGGACVVSGLALGVDGVAMAGAVESGGITVGVLGTGIDVVYPVKHTKLYREVLKKGALVSEFPPGSRATKYSFPLRNRIISGMTDATLVTEARISGGAMITARNSMFQGKRMYALPGDLLLPSTGGPMYVLRNGGHAVSRASDILKDFVRNYPGTLESNLFDLTDVKNSLEEIEAVCNKYCVACKTSLKPAKQDTKAEKQFSTPFFRTEGAKTDNADETTQNSIQNNIQNKIENSNGDSVESHVVHVTFDDLSIYDRAVYNAMVPDFPMTADDIADRLKNIPVGDILASLTMLEICGVIEAGTGGYYLRTSADDIVFDEC